MLISQGNHKMGKDTRILNICAAHDCPSRRLGLCQVPLNRCYACKDEIRYPDTLAYRRRQEIQWDNTSASDFAEFLILKNIRAKKHIANYLRLGESGDFRNQEDVDKAYELADHLITQGIKTYCYTARSDLEFRPSRALTVNGSGFMLDNNYKVVDQGTKAGKDEFLCCGDCRKCALCKYTTKATILTPLRAR